VTDAITVDVARSPDRESLVAALREHGVDVRETDDAGLEIPCGDDAARMCDEIVHELETWIAETGLPLVPVAAEDRVVLRPPGS
jgi:hypothetical protein